MSSGAPWWVVAISLAIGLYGAVLASVTAWRQRWKDKSDVRVECGLSYRPDPAGEDPVLCTTIEATNRGRQVEVRGAGFLRGDRAIELPPFEVDPGPLPKLRADGESIRFHYRGLGRRLPPDRRMAVDRVYVRAGGKRWEAEPPEGMRPLELERRWPYG